MEGSPHAQMLAKGISALKSGLPAEHRDRNGGGGGSRTRVRKCYWSRDYMLIPVHALGITPGRSRHLLRTDKKQLALACDLSLSAQT